jgi:hypothetical protein
VAHVVFGVIVASAPIGPLLTEANLPPQALE